MVALVVTEEEKLASVSCVNVCENSLSRVEPRHEPFERRAPQPRRKLGLRNTARVQGPFDALPVTTHLSLLLHLISHLCPGHHLSMSAELLPATASPTADASTATATAPIPSEVQPPTPTASTTTPPASDKPATHAEGDLAQKPSEAITGLTPEQVLQELKKSGYVDQLRRQMFDAFTAASSVAAGSGAAAASSGVTASGVAGAGPTSQADPSAALPTSTSVSSVPAVSTAADAPLPSTPAASTSTNDPTPLDIGTKPTFLAFLATPLRQQLEKEHGNLRNADARGQQDQLLKLLESEHVAHPQQNVLGDATLYDLLVRHIVVKDDAARGAEGTAGMLDRESGSVGKEAWSRIGDVVDELVNPSAKDGEDDDDDDDDDEDDDDDDAEQAEMTQKVNVPTQSQAPAMPQAPTTTVET